MDLAIAKRWFPIKVDTVVHHEVSGCTIKIYFYTAMVNNKKQ